LKGSGHGVILRHYPGIRLEGLRKTRIAGVKADILTRDCPNTKQNCYPFGHDILKIPVEYDTDTSPAKLTDISRQISAGLLLSVSSWYLHESGMIRTQMRTNNI
jgi:hypothetical protein